MRAPATRLILTVLILAAATAALAADRVVFARHLSLSPDGQALAFSWAGDIWTVSSDGGHARRLTVNPAHESYPVFSPDGQRIAFASDRYGAANVFIMNRDGGDVTRLTFDDRDATPTDWSRDGAAVLFDASKEGQIFREPKMYRVSITGGEPTPVLPCYAAAARVSPDGARLVFTRGNSPWWRRHYRGSANVDLWLYNRGRDEFRQLTDFDGDDRLPCWDADGAGVYFLSDRAGAVNVFHMPLAGGQSQQLTQLDTEDVRDLAVSADGRTLAFTHWDKLYVMRLPEGQPRAITVTAASDTPLTDVEYQTFRRDADELAVSPDTEEIALVVRGEIFVTRTKDDQLTRQVTRSAARDRFVTWSPDGQALFFVSDRTGSEQIFRATSAEAPRKPLADSLRFTIEQVTEGDDPSGWPAISPDGKKLAFVRLRGDLIVRDLVSGAETKLLESWDTPAFAWSPDGKWIAYSVEDIEHNSDVWIMPAGGGPPVNISRHPDADAYPQWSADGQMLAFTSQRHGFDADLYLVFLSSELDQLSQVDLNAYFEEREKAAKKRRPLKSAVASGAVRLVGQPAPRTQPAAPTVAAETQEEEATLSSQLRSVLKQFLEEEGEQAGEGKDDKTPAREYAYDLDTAYKRIRRVTGLPADQRQYAFRPDGAQLAFTSGHTGDAAVYTIKWNGDERNQLFSGGAGALQYSLTGEKLFYLKSGVPGSCGSDGGKPKSHDFAAKMTIDYEAEARQKFDDAARAMGRGFYHPTLKDLDWPNLTEKYRALALQTHTVEEFNEIFSMLLGELNGSHLGIRGGRRGETRNDRVGYLGCKFDPTFAGPGLKVAKVTPESPADRAESRLFPGEVLLAVNDRAVGPDAPLARALIDTIGQPIIVRYLPSPQRPASQPATTAPAETQPAAAAEDQSVSELVIRPISYGEFNNLAYEAWVEASRAYVDEKSGGRVGYLHIRGMSEPSFEVFERDLYAAAHNKDGLIIDVRNNGGGWTADWVMAVLSVRRHAYTIPRGATERGYPQGRLIFYAWTKPATMMCNQYSYSNAEIVSHAFKNLGRGPLVGMTTFGAVISTGAYGLIDGSFIRMPFRGWYTLPDGVDMELNGAEPTVKVPIGPADEAADRDPQLDAAVEATLSQLGD